MAEYMDNFEVKVVARTKGALDAAIRLAMVDHSHVCGWKEEKGSIALVWSLSEKDAIPLPGPTDAQGAVELVLNWLRSNPPPDAEKPDLDGSVSRGFELHARQSVGSYVVFKVRPVWAEHHK